MKLPTHRFTDRKHENSSRLHKIPRYWKYKFFTTVRNPLTYYPSIYSFSRKVPTAHTRKLFPEEHFDDFLDALLNLRVVKGGGRNFKKVCGQSMDILSDLDYGWATFSTVFWTTLGVPDFSKALDNTRVKVFRVEDDFQSQISEYLNVSTDIWPVEKVNTCEHVAQLTSSQEDAIRDRDRLVFEEFDYA